MKYYAGIGSRKTPDDVLTKMMGLAGLLSRHGFVLRSGGARGADSAFEFGAVEKEIFRPFDATPEAIELASEVHPAWDHCNNYARALHGRNTQILLGRDLDEPVEFVICWTPKGKVTGGTGLGIRLAEMYYIPVYNLALEEGYERLEKEVFAGLSL